MTIPALYGPVDILRRQISNTFWGQKTMYEMRNNLWASGIKDILTQHHLIQHYYIVYIVKI